MKEKYDLVCGNYDKETGISTVVISTSLGEFDGYAFLHELDRDYDSRFVGCEYAELRAVNKFLEEENRIYTICIKYAEKLYTIIKSKEDKKLVRDEIDSLTKEKRANKKQIKENKAYIIKKDKDRDLFRKRLDEDIARWSHENES